MQKDPSTAVRQSEETHVGRVGETDTPDCPTYLASPRNNCHAPETIEEEWWSTLSWMWHQEMEPKREHWIARRKNPDVSDASRVYAAQRARSIAVDLDSRVAMCADRKLPVKCGCATFQLRVGCRQRWICAHCRNRACIRLRRRLSQAAKARTAAATKRERWVLLTLTVRHSGDVALDRHRLAEGWRRLRQWLHKRMGRFAYALAWEFTTGDDGRGHVHAHVMALWPWIDWSDVAAQWVRATDGHSTRIDIRAGKKGAKGAANYVSKYLSKGVDLSMDPVLCARVLAAFYCKRTISTSQDFYVPEPKECPRCNEQFEALAKPNAMRQVDPVAVWLADSRVHGVPQGRGPPQLSFRSTPAR